MQNESIIPNITDVRQTAKSAKILSCENFPLYSMYVHYVDTKIRFMREELQYSIDIHFYCGETNLMCV